MFQEDNLQQHRQHNPTTCARINFLERLGIIKNNNEDYLIQQCGQFL